MTIIKEEESVSQLWNEFAENTGFHAFNKLPVRRKSTFRCVWWTLAITMMGGMLCVNFYKELRIYYKRSTLINMKVRASREEAFPAVTVCNFSPVNMTRLNPDEVTRDYLAKLSYMHERESRVNWSDPRYGDFFNKNLSREWLKNVSVDLDVMLEFCKFDGVAKPCREYFEPVFMDTGVCFTFNSGRNRPVKTTRFWSSTANLKIHVFLDQTNYVYSPNMESGVKVIVHDPNKFPGSDSPCVLAADGMTTDIAIQKKQYNFLPYPYLAFDDRACVDTSDEDFVNPLVYSEGEYTYEKCMTECKAKHLLKKCGCVGLSDPIPGPYCSFRNIEICYLPEYYAITSNLTIIDGCDCSMPCKFDKYSTKVSSATFLSDLYLDYVKENWKLNSTEYIRKNYLSLRIYFEDLLVTVTEQSPVYTPETILGSIGGHMGLWMGASILTVGELGEFLFMVTLHVRNKIKQWWNKSSTVSDIKINPNNFDHK